MASSGDFTFPPPSTTLMYPDHDADKKDSVYLKETADFNTRMDAVTVGMDHRLFLVNRLLLAVKEKLELILSEDSFSQHQLTIIQEELVDIERHHKKEGIWEGHLTTGVIPTGQGYINDLLEKCHQLETEVIERMPEKRET